MSCLIAVSGKGGVGKTTIAGVLVRCLIDRGKKPVLAVDADPNSCLDIVLGVRVSNTVGRVREEARQIASKGLSSGVSKQQLLELKIAECLVEAKDFDLIAMGRSEGQGCYCYANNVLKEAIGVLSSQYPYVVLDNEAGLENLSRRIVRKIDLLIMAADASRTGLTTLVRLHALTQEIGVSYEKLAILINRLHSSKIPSHALEIKETINAGYIRGIPEDERILSLSETGQSVFTVPNNNPVVAGIEALLEDALIIERL